VGALVVNEHKEVLMVMERSGPLKGRKVWKMPTGWVGGWVGQYRETASEIAVALGKTTASW
jgi:hypothetical protein